MNKLYILIVNNRVGYPIEGSLQDFQDWLAQYTPFQAEFSFLNVDLSLSFKEFIPIQGQMQYGLNGIKEQLRQTNQIPFGKYHCVVFLYSALNWNFASKPVANWTYPNHLNGAAFIECPIVPFWSYAQTEGLRVLSHEILHAFHRLCWWKGIPTRDTMDLYDKEFEVFATDGNRARNLLELKPHFNEVSQLPIARWLDVVYQQVLKLLELIKLLPQMDKLTEFCKAVQQYEGWYEGSRSFRNNNPGNLKYTNYTAGLGAYSKDDKGFCIFRDYDSGFKALRQLVTDASHNLLRAYRLYAQSLEHTEITIMDFFNVYAPASDANEPNAYALWVSQKLKVAPETKLVDLIQ